MIKVSLYSPTISPSQIVGYYRMIGKGLLRMLLGLKKKEPATLNARSACTLPHFNSCLKPYAGHSSKRPKLPRGARTQTTGLLFSENLASNINCSASTVLSILNIQGIGCNAQASTIVETPNRLVESDYYCTLYSTHCLHPRKFHARSTSNLIASNAQQIAPILFSPCGLWESP